MSGQDGRALLAKIRPTKRIEKIQVCLRPDLILRHIELCEALVEEQVSPRTARLAGGGGASTKKAKAIAKEIQELEAIIPDHSVWFTFEQLDGPDWQALLDDHPPREGFELDFYAGYNRDGVLDQAIHDCLIDPVFEDCDGTMPDPNDSSKKVDCPHDECGTFQQFRKQCPGGEWAELRSVVNIVNSGVVESPKSELASRILRPRANASAQPGPGE